MATGIDQIVATIAAGTSLSAAVGLGIKTLVGIVMPAAWTTAGLTFQSSVDGGQTFVELLGSTGTALGLTVAASQHIAVDPALWRSVNNIIIRSGTLGSPVNQVAQASLILLVKPVA